MSYGYFEGYSDNTDIHYCPACGGEIGVCHGDGSAICDECGERFAVITISEGNEGDSND